MSEENKTFLGVMFTSIILVICVFAVGVCLFNILTKDKNKQKKPYITLGIFSLIAILDIPFLINELYKHGLNMKNTYTTMWGAESALSFYGTFLAFIGTVSLGAISLWQTSYNRKQGILHNNEIQLGFYNETFDVNQFVLSKSKSTYLNPLGDNCFKIQDSISKQGILYMDFQLKSVNGRIPDRFKIKRIAVKTDYNEKNILGDDLSYEDKYKIIINKQNPFTLYLLVLDDALNELDRQSSKLIIDLEIIFITEDQECVVATEYSCLLEINYQHHGSTVPAYSASGNVKLLHKNKLAYFIQ